MSARDATSEPPLGSGKQRGVRGLSLAIAAVLALAIAAWASSQSFGDVPETNARITAYHSARSGLSPSPAGAQKPLAAVTFTASHGYALVPNCVTDDTGQRNCSYQLWNTGDGGESWRGYPFPASHVQDPHLVASGENSVLVEARQHRWFSADRGHTWTEYGNQPIGTVRAVPESALVSARCVDPHCVTTRILATLPDGTLVRLANSPELGRPTSSDWVQSRHGALWLTGTNASGDPIVVSSSDGGASWHTASLASAAPLQKFYAPTFNNVDGYLVMCGGTTSGGGEVNAEANANPAAIQILSTNNGGQSWNDVTPTTALSQAPTAAAVASTGELMIVVDSTLLVSGDGGATFQAVPDAPRISSISPTGLSTYLATSPGGAHYVSADGLHWTHLRLDTVA